LYLFLSIKMVSLLGKSLYQWFDSTHFLTRKKKNTA
jgi:hypothetical protein